MTNDSPLLNCKRSCPISHFTSFVQIRGSIPLFWSQDNNFVTPKPQIMLQRRDPFYASTILHFAGNVRRDAVAKRKKKIFSFFLRVFVSFFFSSDADIMLRSLETLRNTFDCSQFGENGRKKSAGKYAWNGISGCFTIHKFAFAFRRSDTIYFIRFP